MLKILLKIKMWFNRAYGHVAFPINIVQNFMLLYLFIKSTGIAEAEFWSIGVSLLTIILLLIIGYLDVHYGVYKLENTINNEHNEELLRAAGKK